MSASTRQLHVLDIMENRYADDRYDQLHVELHFSHGYVDGVSTCHVLVSMARTNQKPEKLVRVIKPG